MKIWKTAIISIFLSFSASVDALMIDHGDFTTDTVSGLDWLDLKLTTNMSLSEAANAFDGYRLATNNEVEGLFSSMFSGYYETISSIGISYSLEDSYANQESDISEFESLFGTTLVDQYGRATYGLYMDENNIQRMMGTQIWTTDSSSAIYSPQFINSYTPQFASPAFGTYLVRNTVSVIEPSTLWLAGIGLLLVVSRSFGYRNSMSV